MSPHQVLEPQIGQSQSKPTWMGKGQLYLDLRFKADLPEISTFWIRPVEFRSMGSADSG